MLDSPEANSERSTTMFASGEVVPAQPSQESHLLSPDISAAGSDNGRLEDLKGEVFSELVEAERDSLAKEEEAAAAAATPYHRQQTLLKTPASLANPGTCSTSMNEVTGKSKANTPQATQKPGKSNNAKMSTKSALSASRRAASINIQIVRLASSASLTRPSSSSSSSSSATANKTKSSAPQYGPSHSFSMNMLPMTKIRELCLHAAGHARRHFDVVLDGSRFEARDRDGHVFQGHETLSEEILSGETIYLVEGGLDVRGAARAAARGSKGASEKPKASTRERGRLMCLKSLELEGEEEQTKTPYRTPSVSSRASSSRSESKGKAGQPRLTASQKALAIAQAGRTPAPKEPVAGRKLLTSSAVKKSLTSPALEKVGEATDEEVRDRGMPVDEPTENADLDATLVSASPLRSSTPPPRQPQSPQQHAVPPNLQDSQLVIPDSQDPFSQGLFSQESVEPDHPSPAIPTPDTSTTHNAQPRPSPRVGTTTAQPKLQMSRPDPYDINTVLSDEENERSDESNTNTTASIKMSASIRKLGSATAKRRSIAPPPVSLPSPRQRQLSEASPLRENEARAPAVTSKKATPTKKSTPTKANHSSPAVPLPSSPTTHVAAAIAKGRQRVVEKIRQPSLPSPGQLVLRVPSDSDADDDLIEEAFRDLSGSIPTPSLPWSAPPLRAAPDAESTADKQSSPSRSPAGRRARDVKYGILVEDEVCIVGVSPRKSPLKSPAKKPLGQSPSSGKKASQRSPSKPPIITSPSKKEEATIVHDSSSAEESEHEEDLRIVKEEPPSSEEDISSKTKLANVPIVAEKHQHVESIQQPEVIELSSGSDSDIEPSKDTLEDDEAELPSIDVELLMERERLPSLPRSPAQAIRSPMRKSPKTDPVKIEPGYKEPPPSAQASKRKRPASEEPELEDEQHRRKRVKREAKKARKKRNREQRAIEIVQEEKEKQLAALQEERKQLALEKAHRRALELEVIVSSPIKRESSIELSEEGDDEDSGLGSSAYGDDAGADQGRAGVPLDGDDKNDSLSSKEAEGHHPSWRKLSKLHFSSSPSKGSQDGSGVAPTSTPAIIEAQLQQCIEEQFHRMPFDDWAFLENTLGKGLRVGCGYSPLEVHNRVHLDMMHRARHPPLYTSGERKSSDASAMIQTEPKSSALPSQADDDDSRSQRSEAPSPKEHRASEEKTEETREEVRKQRTRKKRAKPREKLQHERARKRERESKANRRYHHDFRNALVGYQKRKKQQHRQKGQ